MMKWERFAEASFGTLLSVDSVVCAKRHGSRSPQQAFFGGSGACPGVESIVAQSSLLLVCFSSSWISSSDCIQLSSRLDNPHAGLRFSIHEAFSDRAWWCVGYSR